MELTQQEIRRNRAISSTVTLMIFALFLLFLILFKLITPNPPFPESGGGGGQELALGLMNVGTEEIDYTDMGKVTDVVAEKEPEKEDIVTSENGENVAVPEPQPEVKNDKMVIKPVKKEVKEVKKEVVKEKTAAEKAAELFKKNAGKKSSGETQTPGNEGAPGGEPGKTGTGGSGDGTGGGNGPGDGPGSGPGTGGIGGGRYGFDLKGATVVKPPKLPTDTKEEGKVVVEITVDSEGNVIEANPNGRGTTTSSALLKAKARQAALATKFKVSGKFEEQKGTITIIFSFN
jgi:outer membrane biosynthesis protein TonB